LVCSEDNSPFFKICKKGDIGFCFLGGSAHHIARRDSYFTFGLPVGHSSPLLALNEIGMDPHNLSLRSGDREETLFLLVVGISIDHSQFPFRDGSHFGWRWWETPAKLKG